MKILFVDAPTPAMPLLALLTPVAMISSAQRHLELLRTTQAHRIAPGPTVNHRDGKHIFLVDLRSAQVCQLLVSLIRMKLSFINYFSKKTPSSFGHFIDLVGQGSDTFFRSTINVETTYSWVKKSSDNYAFNDCLTIHCCTTSKYFDTEKSFKLYINQPHIEHFDYADGQL